MMELTGISCFKFMMVYAGIWWSRDEFPVLNSWWCMLVCDGAVRNFLIIFIYQFYMYTGACLLARWSQYCLLLCLVSLVSFYVFCPLLLCILSTTFELTMNECKMESVLAVVAVKWSWYTVGMLLVLLVCKLVYLLELLYAVYLLELAVGVYVVLWCIFYVNCCRDFKWAAHFSRNVDSLTFRLRNGAPMSKN
jgi:hypothetical protein